MTRPARPARRTGTRKPRPSSPASSSYIASEEPRYIASEEPRQRRTLATLREHLTAAPDAFSALLGRMQGTAAAGGLIARAANRHRGKDNREAAGVLSAAQRHTHF